MTNQDLTESIMAAAKELHDSVVENATWLRVELLRLDDQIHSLVDTLEEECK